MQMLCTRNEDIIVAVFFDVKTCVTTSTENQGSVREFLNQASVLRVSSLVPVRTWYCLWRWCNVLLAHWRKCTRVSSLVANRQFYPNGTSTCFFLVHEHRV